LLGVVLLLLLLLLLPLCMHSLVGVEKGQVGKHIRADITLEADVGYGVL